MRGWLRSLTCSWSPAGALRYGQRRPIRDVLPSTLVLIKTEQTFLMSITLARLSQVKRRFHIHVSKAHSSNRLHIQNWVIASAGRLERNQEHSLPTQTNLSSGCQSDTLLFLSWETIQGKLEPCRQPVGSPAHSEGQGSCVRLQSWEHCRL